MPYLRVFINCGHPSDIRRGMAEERELIHFVSVFRGAFTAAERWTGQDEALGTSGLMLWVNRSTFALWGAEGGSQRLTSDLA